MNFYQFFEKKIKNKSIIILGLGKEGLSSLNLILKTGTYSGLAIADSKEQSPEFLYNSLKETHSKETLDKTLKEIKTYYGTTYQKHLNQYDLILKSPGVVLEESVDKGKISSSMQIFCEYYKDRIIGITGTKGKSTTASLLHHTLQKNNIPAVLAGNIGIPVFDIPDEIRQDTKIVLEMSCHQLEYMTVSPHIGVLLNLHEEHLDHYGSYRAYCMAKHHIFKHMEAGSHLISCTDIEKESIPEGIKTDFISYVKEKKNTAIRVDENGFSYENEYFPIPDDLPLIGIHNIYNIASIYPIIKNLQIDFQEFIHSLYSFKPLPHRLEFIGRIQGIDFYDDSISTMGASTINAVTSLKNTATVLIGGMDRGIDYLDLTDFIIEHPDYIYILMEATGKRIYFELKEKTKISPNIILTEHLEDAVELAFELTPKGKACILSPAAASYGIFRNFEHRGEVFQRLIHKRKSPV